MRSASVFIVSSAMTLLALSISNTAAAQTPGGPSWRQRARPNQTLPDSKFTFETRFGGYYPKVDEEFGADGPFAQYFGKGPQFYFGLGLDWTPLRIPYVGRIGPAVGWGFTTMNGDARKVSDPSAAVDGVDTSLTIHAMNVSASLRIDEIARRTVVPIVPYAKFGLGMGLWSSGTSAGTSKIGTDCNATTPTDCTKGEGLSIGPQFSLGAMLGMNWLDPRSGAMVRENSGVNQVYIFGEWMWSGLDYSINKDAMRVGTSSWVLGLALDL
ncbi:MAG: hypothetical protein IPK82_03540 [Polyangiaceae bacterium]|nr:hypothetical protein [Polyangiaceae bacterium]